MMKFILRFLSVLMTAIWLGNASAQVNPTVSIDGGSRFITDTDGMPGEAVLLRATAADRDGVISDIEWLKDGFPEGWGEELFFSLDDGPNIIRVVVTDNDGLKAEDTVTIKIGEPGEEIGDDPQTDSAPGEPLDDDPEVNISPDGIQFIDSPPVVSIISQEKTFEDTDGLNTELIEVTANAFDLESLSSIYWTVDDGAPQSRVSGLSNSYRASFSFRAAPGMYKITVYAVDSAGYVNSAEVTIEVKGISDRAPKFTINNASDVADTNNVAGESIELEISRDTASQEDPLPTQFILVTSYPPSQSFSKSASINEMLNKLENIARNAPADEITLLFNYVSEAPKNNMVLDKFRIPEDGESSIYVTLIQADGLGSTVSKTFNIAPPPERPELSFGYVPSVVADTDEKPGETVNIEVIIESEDVIYLLIRDQFDNKLFEFESETALQVGNLTIPLELLADGHNEILVTARNKAGGTDTISTGDLKIEVRASEYSELDFGFEQESITVSGGTSKAAFYLLVTTTTEGKTSGRFGKIVIDPDEGFEVIVRIEPQANHIGKEAELFVIAQYTQPRAGSSYYNLNEKGNWVAWDGSLTNLQEFESVILEEKNTRTILKADAGVLSGSSTLMFWVAYGLKGQSELYYTGNPIFVDLK